MSDNTTPTHEQKTQKEILARLDELAAGRVTDQSLIFQGTQLIVPESMTPQDLLRFVMNYIDQNEQQVDFSRTFNYRPWDGAAAFERAMRRVFGTAGIGKTLYSFFGAQHPEFRTVVTGPGETMQVPWGAVTIPMLEGTTCYLGSAVDEELGAVFRVTVECPKKHRATIEGFFDVVLDELQERSIYRGQAFDGKSEPDFIDTLAIDPAKVVYSDEVHEQLEANVWSLLRHTEAMREMGVPLKRAVLLEGPYGTGKTLAGQLTAKYAVENGWTYVYYRPGRDNLMSCIQTARLYQPSVLYIEDVDTYADGEATDRDKVSQMLDVFDGIQAKDTEMLMVMTTNHVERIHKGMVRPGRLDAIVHIGALDRNGVERLIRQVVKPDLLGDLNYDEVYRAMEGFMPAFVKEAIDRAVRYAISRTGGTEFRLETPDFLAAAHGLRPQLELMEGAKEGARESGIISGLRDLVREGVHGIQVISSDEEELDIGRLVNSDN